MHFVSLILVQSYYTIPFSTSSLICWRDLPALSRAWIKTDLTLVNLSLISPFIFPSRRLTSPLSRETAPDTPSTLSEVLEWTFSKSFRSCWCLFILLLCSTEWSSSRSDNATLEEYAVILTLETVILSQKWDHKVYKFELNIYSLL